MSIIESGVAANLLGWVYKSSSAIDGKCSSERHVTWVPHYLPAIHFTPISLRVTSDHIPGAGVTSTLTQVGARQGLERIAEPNGLLHRQELHVGGERPFLLWGAIKRIWLHASGSESC